MYIPRRKEITITKDDSQISPRIILLEIPSRLVLGIWILLSGFFSSRGGPLVGGPDESVFKGIGHKGLGCSERRRGGYGEYEFKAAWGWGIGVCAGGSCLMPI